MEFISLVTKSLESQPIDIPTTEKNQCFIGRPKMAKLAGTLANLDIFKMEICGKHQDFLHPGNYY